MLMFQQNQGKECSFLTQCHVTLAPVWRVLSAWEQERKEWEQVGNSSSPGETPWLRRRRVLVSRRILGVLKMELQELLMDLALGGSEKWRQTLNFRPKPVSRERCHSPRSKKLKNVASRVWMGVCEREDLWLNYSVWCILSFRVGFMSGVEGGFRTRAIYCQTHQQLEDFKSMGLNEMT